MEKINQRISELCAAITKESNPAEVIRLSAELNRILATRLLNRPTLHRKRPELV